MSITPTTGGNTGKAPEVVEFVPVLAFELVLGAGMGLFEPSTKNITTAATAMPPPAAYIAFIFKTVC
jgi:hypothetical protein